MQIYIPRFLRSESCDIEIIVVSIFKLYFTIRSPDVYQMFKKFTRIRFLRYQGYEVQSTVVSCDQSTDYD